MADESERIDQIIRRESFCEHTAGASGIAVVNAPELAEPYPPSESYAFRDGRDRRVSGARATTPPRSRSARARRSASAPQTGSLGLAQ
jgi:hypothetical protein